VDPFKYDKEATFAQVLSRIDPRVDVRILLDQHRALRPVPVPPANGANPHRSSATISSAEACRRALAQRPKLPDESHNGTADTEHSKSQIHLLSVLGPWLSRLPNPYNEIAGVFHVKLYVVDDAVLLSGANLSQEYFADRHDRYVCIYNGGNGLVDTYVDLIQALSEFGSQRYEGIDENGVAQLTNVPDRQRLFRAIRDVLTIEADTAGIDHEPDPDVIAYAVPTFQAPPGYFTATCDATELATMPTDLQTIHDLLRQTAAWAPAAASSSSSSLSAPQTTATTATTTHQSRPVTLRLASAYLNPTRSFLESTRNLNVFFLTAGKLSHGFRPKKVTGHVSKTAWIPTVFATLVASYPPWVKTWWYQRESWTFHAKGLWLTTTAETVPESTTTTSKTNVPTLTKSQLRIPETDELLVVSHGSGNYGYRSEQRDMESNLLLVFPSPTDGQESNNPWAQQHIDEWNEFVPSAVPACLEDTDRLPKPVQWVLPYIKSFF
jgi:CDP-diacylglycerol--glycerol-3-phosphate 3-phosphatidyltransferase